MFQRWSTLLKPLSLVLGLSSATLAAPLNIVPNGDFESGNTGFTSEYDFSPDSNPTESQYAILTDPNPWNPNFLSIGDRTTGTGRMFVGNGSPQTTRRVWSSQGISVDAGREYYFEAYLLNVVNTERFKPGAAIETFPTLSFYANGTLLGTRQSDQLGIWQGFGMYWYSDTATSVDLEIRNLNDSILGNDFALDDISLRPTGDLIATPVPEPTSVILGLMGAGWLGLRQLAKRRRSARG